MIQVNIHEAKTHLTRLLERVSDGEEVVIARAGRPIAKLLPIATSTTGRLPGSERGKITMSADFDAPLDPETFEPER